MSTANTRTKRRGAALRSGACALFHIVEYTPAHMVPALGEFEQLVLIAIVRLGPDAYGATIGGSFAIGPGHRDAAALPRFRSRIPKKR